MQAITTKYLPPTNFNGARIKAKCAAGSVTVGYYDCEKQQDGYTPHHYAAIVLLVKLGWGGRWLAGSTDTGNVYVCIPGSRSCDKGEPDAVVIMDDGSEFVR